MHQEKVGQFIKELREEKGFNQETLAQKVHIGREAVSKWERGKTLPDTSTLVLLSEIFNISINEILMGERNTKENATLELYKDRNKLNKRIKKIIVITVLMVFISITSFLTYYFINQYKSIHAYTITGFNENFDIKDGLFVKTKGKIYFNLGKIENRNNLKIDKIDLLYIEDSTENIIYSVENDDTVVLNDYYGYDEYFNSSKLNTIIKDLYVKIYFKEDTELVKLNLIEDYVNDKVIFSKKEKISDQLQSTEKNLGAYNELELKIYNNYDKKGDFYIYKTNEGNLSKEFIYSTEDKMLIVTALEKGKIKEEYYYQIENDTLDYNYYENSDLMYSFVYSNNNFECTFGNCINEKEKLEEFRTTLDITLN